MKKSNQLIRCPCGNILAGYDGDTLTIRKKADPSPWNPAKQTSK